MGPVPWFNQTDEVSTFPLREGKTKPNRIRDLGSRKKKDSDHENAKEKNGYIIHNVTLMVNNPSTWLKTITSIISAVG